MFTTKMTQINIISIKQIVYEVSLKPTHQHTNQIVQHTNSSIHKDEASGFVDLSIFNPPQ
jgi:hypothetical protein